MIAPNLTSNSSTPLLENTLYLAEHLGPVFPLRRYTKEPYDNEHFGLPDSPPRGFHLATTNPTTIEERFTRCPHANIGLGLVKVAVIDIDVHEHDGHASFARFCEQYSIDLSTVEARTATNGSHYYVRPTPGLRRKIGVLPGVDYLVNGYVVAPPSRTNKGEYRWVGGHAPWEHEIAELPDVLREAIEQAHEGRAYAYTSPRGSSSSGGARSRTVSNVDAYLRTVLDNVCDPVASVQHGQRREALNRAGFVLGQYVGGGVLDQDVARDRLAAAFRRAGHTLDYKAEATIDIAITEGRDQPIHLVIEGTGRSSGTHAVPNSQPNNRLNSSDDAASSFSKPPSEPSQTHDSVDDLHLTDMGNAMRFAQQRGGYNRYCYEWSQWLTYDQGRWRSDRPDLVMRAAKDTVRSIYGEAKDEIDDKKRKVIADWAKKSESHQRITAMLALAQSELPLSLAQLNADPWLLNCANGTVNLRSGVLQRHRPEDWLTHQTSVAYDREAVCPVWMAFLARVFADNDELTSFVQRGLGYTMTASVREQCMFFLYGTGSNGKSTLLGTIQEILGRDYSMQATSEFLLDKKGGSDHPTERADLFQKRFVSTIEVENGRRMAEALMKQLTGGDRIRARRMRENFWEFDPTHKIFLAANHKPTIKGNDHGVWRRIHLVPFDVTIPDSEKDMALGDKLRAEMPGILAWLVRGCIAWQRQGLAPPKKVRDATAEYRAEMDVLAAFLADRCVINDKARVTARDLYAAYCAWCDDNGERKDSAKAFGVQLDERGFVAGKSGSERFRRGLALIPPPAPPPPDDPFPTSYTAPAPDSVRNGTHASHGTRFDPISGIANTKLSHEADIGKNVSHTSQTCPKNAPKAANTDEQEDGDLVPDTYDEGVV